MANFIPFNRERQSVLPPDIKSRPPSDGVAHFIVAAVGHVPVSRFAAPERTGNKPQLHPRPMPASLIRRHADGVFPSRRIERAARRDPGAGLLSVGAVSIDGARIDAGASKPRSIRRDRITASREKLAADIAGPAAKAEDHDPLAPPAEKQTVEPVFGIIKSVPGFIRFRPRGLERAATERTPVTPARNCRRPHKLKGI